MGKRYNLDEKNLIQNAMNEGKSIEEIQKMLNEKFGVNRTAFAIKSVNKTMKKMGDKKDGKIKGDNK